MGRDRADEQSLDANPVQDEVAVHSNVRGDLTIPVSCGLKLIESIFEGIFVVGSANDNKCEAIEKINANLLLVVTFSDVNEIVDFFFEDLVMVVTRSMPHVWRVFDHFLQ